MKLPLINEKYRTAGWIAAAALAVLCLAWRWLPGFEYATGVFLIGITVLLALFAGEATRATTQMVVLTFFVGTGILLMATRYDALMGGITFGPSLLPVNDQLGVLSGLLWLTPVLTSLQLAEKLAGSIYMRSLIGALLVLAPSLFMLLCADSQLLFFWKSTVSIKAILIWFVGGFFFHFAANQLGVQKNNPVAPRLYFVYLGFFVVAWLLKLINPASL